MCFGRGKLNHDSKLCTNKKDSEQNLYGKCIRAEDKSWNILVWSDDLQVRNNFRVISMVEMATPAADRVQLLPESEGMRLSLTIPTVILFENDLTAIDETHRSKFK